MKEKRPCKRCGNELPINLMYYIETPNHVFWVCIKCAIAIEKEIKISCDLNREKQDGN